MSMRAGLAVLLFIAQTATTFEVVSIKPGVLTEATRIRRVQVQNNRWTTTRSTVREIIREAYKSDALDMPDRVVGGPKWLDEDQFNIVATSASTPTQAQRELMIRAMLADRFHLATHLEQRTLPAYELVRARRDGALGPRLHRATTDCAPRCSVSAVFGSPIHMESAGADMKRFAFTLATLVLRQPVIDRTGLDGIFALDIDFDSGADLVAAPPSDAPSIFTAVEEQLGLKLRSVKAPLDVLVIDRAERPAFD